VPAEKPGFRKVLGGGAQDASDNMYGEHKYESLNDRGCPRHPQFGRILPNSGDPAGEIYSDCRLERLRV
jgi:hypothetical protein